MTTGDQKIEPARESAVRIFRSWDFGLGLAVGVGTFFGLRASDFVTQQGVTILLAEAALGIAVLAVALTALSILVGLLGDEYIRVLEMAHARGVTEALLPFQIVAWIGGATTLVGLGVLVAWDIRGPFNWSTPTLRAIGIALPTALSAWCVAGTISLVNATVFHGEMRAKFRQVLQDAAALAEREKKNRSVS